MNPLHLHPHVHAWVGQQVRDTTEMLSVRTSWWGGHTQPGPSETAIPHFFLLSGRGVKIKLHRSSCGRQCKAAGGESKPAGARLATRQTLTGYSLSARSWTWPA
eukprot:1137936-Pelagomonas_calceolata.AAC.4